MKCCSAGGINKKRGLVAQTHEVGTLHVQLPDGVCQTRTLQHARGCRDNARAATGDGGAILAVPNETGPEFARTAVNNGQTGSSDQWSQLSFKELVTDTKFAVASGIETNVEAATGALVAEHRDAGEPAERIAGPLGHEDVGRHEYPRLSQRLIILSGRQITGAEQKIRSPLTSAMKQIHERDAGAG